MDSGSFKYDLLKDEHNEIRLVQIIPPRSGQTTIRLKLKHFGLKQMQGKFRAVSYVWGDTKSTSELIIVNRKRFWQHHNIMLFYQHCLEFKVQRSVWLWIDSVCINQKDEQEKGHQVDLMGRIYRSAQLVLVWMPAIQTIPPEPKRTGDGGSRIGHFQNIVRKLKLSRAARDSDSNNCSDNLWYWIMQDGYWQRVWTMQEVHLTKRPLVMFRNLSIDNAVALATGRYLGRV